MFDLAPAADEMTRLLRGVRDDHLGSPTPCDDWTVADLLAHVHQFSTVLTQNAAKEAVRPPDGLVDDWREVVPQQLKALVTAWQADSAWAGQVSAGGVEMPAADNAVVAVEELVVHGWDLARSTGQDFHASELSLDRVDDFFGLFGGAPFGDERTAPEEADRLDRTIARTGRDPGWTPTA